MATDAEENLPEETEVEDKINTVRSLAQDHKYPLTMTDDGNLGFFLSRPMPVSKSCSRFPRRRLQFSQVFEAWCFTPVFSLFPFSVSRLAACLVWLCGIAWCTFLLLVPPP